MAGKYCMKCGTFLPEDANFCYKCGAHQDNPIQRDTSKKDQEKSLPKTPLKEFKFVTLENRSVELDEYVGHSDTVSIPETVSVLNTKTGESRNLPVESIGDSAFSCNKDLVKIYIPNSVKRIKEDAFYSCDNLKHIDLPESIKVLENGCFNSCDNLTTINLPTSLEKIGESVFWNCKNLLRISIPSSVTTIGKDAFSFCEKLEMLELPSNLVEIGNDAFYSCENLQSITIPDKVQIIGDGAFHGCEHLKYVYLPDSIKSIGKEAFYYCKRLITISIPENVKAINKETFANCDKLRKVVIGKNTTTIADDAFYGCSPKLAIQAPRGSYAELFGNTHGIPVRENVSLVEIKNIENIEPNNYSVSYPNLGKSKEELFHPAQELTAPYYVPFGVIPFTVDIPSYYSDEFEIVYNFFANEITGVNSNGESRQNIIKEFCSASDDDSYEIGDEISFNLKLDNSFSLYSQKIQIILPGINKQIGVLPHSLSKLVKPLLDKKYLYHLYGKFEMSPRGYFCDMRLVFNNMKYPTTPYSDDYSYYIPVEYFPQHLQKDIKRRMKK